MKMEVLAVQSQFQSQFSVMQPKVKGGWTKPLTAPKSTTQATKATQVVEKSSIIYDDDDDDFLPLPTFNDDAIQALAEQLSSILRDAKHHDAHMTNTEVLLPCQLLQRCAMEMLIASDCEACGIRGCNITIEFENENGECRQIASFKTDNNTVSTFELILTLKQDRSGWKSILPQFLKNLTRGGTIVINRDFTVIKNKLSYSFSE